MHALRRVARRVRDEGRRTSPLVLSAVVAAAIIIPAVLALTVVALLAPPNVTIALVGVIAAAALAAVIVAWLNLARQVRALRTSNDRVEVTQRRILAAIEQERLDAERRRSLPVG